MADELLEMFLEETAENLQYMEEGLLELETNPGDPETINNIFRAMHTIKGGAGLVGLQTISELSHKVENLLDDVRQSKLQMDDNIFRIMFSGGDILKKMLTTGDFEGEQLADDISELYGLIAKYDGDAHIISEAESSAQQATSNKEKTFKITMSFDQAIMETGTDPIMLLRELQELGELTDVICEIDKLPLIDELLSHSFYLAWSLLLHTEHSKQDVDNIFIFVMDDNQITVEEYNVESAIELAANDQDNEVEAVISQPVASAVVSAAATTKQKPTKQPAKEQEVTSTIRVETAKLEGILNNLAELLISQSRVKELVLTNLAWQSSQQNHTINREIIAAFDEVDKIIRVVQEKVMNTSMVPIAGTFTRFQRMMRDLAKDVGKELAINIEGKDTELDKKVIEQIADPLKHLIRNALDHGIELPTDRVAADKPSYGTISLRAFHQEGSIVIQIEDDGKGIDEQAIFAKAIEKGIVEETAQLSKQEMYMLLFQPGFSTAKKITDISGRGVGLDVVITNIKKLRGTVEMDSRVGEGTTITIKLPLTLAIIDGMMVRIGQERFVIPLNMISEFYKVEKSNVHKAEGRGVFIHLRGENMPYVGLAELLGINGECSKAEDGILVILQNNKRKLAMMVDEILGQEQVVIKSLKENMNQQVEGIAGVTILGNGNVAIILDIPTIFNLVKEVKPIKQLA